MKVSIFATLLGFVVVFFTTQGYCAGSTNHLELQIGGTSWHEQKRADGKPWNQSNPGIGLQYVIPGEWLGHSIEYYIAGGAVRNSGFRGTIYLGAGARKIMFEMSAVKL